MSERITSQRIRTRLHAKKARNLAEARRNEWAEELLALHNASGAAVASCTGTAGLFLALGAILASGRDSVPIPAILCGVVIIVCALLVSVFYCINLVEVGGVYSRYAVTAPSKGEQERVVVRTRRVMGAYRYMRLRRRIYGVNGGSIIAILAIYLFGLLMLSQLI